MGGYHTITIEPTNTFPILNFKFQRSFVKMKNKSKAILKQGWGPVNWEILLSSDVQQTTTYEYKTNN